MVKESNYKKLTAKEAEKEIAFYGDHGYVSRMITEDDFRTTYKQIVTPRPNLFFRLLTS